LDAEEVEEDEVGEQVNATGRYLEEYTGNVVDSDGLMG
jgi:hypothetical protein